MNNNVIQFVAVAACIILLRFLLKSKIVEMYFKNFITSLRNLNKSGLSMISENISEEADVEKSPLESEKSLSDIEDLCVIRGFNPNLYGSDQAQYLDLRQELFVAMYDLLDLSQITFEEEKIIESRLQEIANLVQAPNPNFELIWSKMSALDILLVHHLQQQKTDSEL